MLILKCAVQVPIFPSEEAVTLTKSDGTTLDVSVHASNLREDGLIVGEVANDKGSVLVELPCEAMDGSWRLWVPRSSVIEELP